MSGEAIFQQLLAEALLWLMLLGSGLALIVGLWLLLAPASFARLDQFASRHISLRRALRPLEIPRNLDRHIYRHHRLLGLLIVAASGFTLYRLLFAVEAAKSCDLIIGRLPEALCEALFSALQLTLILGHLFAIIIGLVLYQRPSALKGVEARANRWVSSRKKSRWLDAQYPFTSQLMQSHPRLLGLAILLLSLYLASLLLVR